MPLPAVTATAPHAPPAPDATDSLHAKIRRALAGRCGFVPMTPAEERELGRRARAGDEEAQWALVMANANFARALATRYLREGVEHEDLVSEGLAGLLEAAVRFDPDRGIKFITYGAWWIKRAILRHLRTFGQAVHVPKYKHHELLELRRVHAGLAQSLGREPTLLELEAATGASPRELQELLGLSTPPASLEPDSVLGSLHAIDAEAAAVRDDILARVRALWPELSDRQQRVLLRRFGLDGADHETLAALGDELGLTKERVRQIEKEACARLRLRLETPPRAAA
jgi:RNA polymerase primary sigma factor